MGAFFFVIKRGMSNRTHVYIDGFNFYYGVIKGSREKWLDVHKLCKMLRNADDLLKIYYFTARVDPNHSARTRQDEYLRAIATLPIVTIVEGKFKRKNVTCGRPGCSNVGKTQFTVPEEKRTDVNIALQMVQDAVDDLCDRLVLISGDSDLVPAINAVKARCPTKEVVVYVPSRNPFRGAAVEIRSAADKDRTFPINLLKHAQFPKILNDGLGRAITKPATW